MKRQMQQAQMGLLGAQLQEHQMKVKAAEEAALQDRAFQEALQARTTPSQALAGGGGPTPANAALIGQQQPLNYDQLSRQFPGRIDLIERLSKAPNFGRQEVARTVEGRDAEGRPVVYQLDKFGERQGAPIEQWKAPVQADTGGALGFVDPVTLRMLQQFQKTNSPDALLSSETTRRGQNMADARAREKNAIDRDAVGKVDWKQDSNGNWVGLPKDVRGTGPVTPVTTTTPSKREQQARSALDILDEAEPLLKKATGSYVGAGVDQAARAFGLSTSGGQYAAQLRTLEGALMMAQPRMEGPQSNFDVQLYRQMAGQIGDPTVPAAVKQAAAKTIRQLHQRYAGQKESSPPADLQEAARRELERRRNGGN